MLNSRRIVQQSTTSRRIVRFGPFELDLATGELRKHGVRLRIQDQPFQILVALLEKPGEIVSRETLVGRLWPPGTFVDSDRSLNAAVNRLRQVLRDSAESPKYVETVSKRGYRFVGQVIPEHPSEAIPTSSSTVVPSRPLRWTWFAATMGLVTTLFGAFYLLRPQTDITGPALQRITTESGLAMEPALSPDGKLVAYASDREGRNLNLWVQQLSGGTAVQITHESVDVHSPSFSSDGTKIVYRSEGDGGGIYRIPTFGGVARKIADQGRDPRYSPDGKWIAYWSGVYKSSLPNSQAVGSTFIVSSEGGVPKPIGADLPSAAYPVWSSDSKYLTVLVDRDRIDQDWWIIPVQGGNAVQTHAFERLKKLGMTISYGMEPPKISSWIGSTLLFSAKFGDAVNVWKARFTLPNGALENVQRETSGTNLEVDAAYTYDGNLSFASILRDVSIYSLSGNTNTASFAELSRITKGSGDHLTPSLSRDGQILAYSCGKTSSICLKDLTTGKESTLTDGPHSRPKISNDNKTIAYAMIGGDSIPLFTMPITGGPSEKIADDGGWAFGWSRNDRNLVFSKAHTTDIYFVDVATRKQSRFAAQPGHGLYQCTFSSDGQWVVFESVVSRLSSELFVARVNQGAIAPISEWIGVGFHTGWDDKPRWSPNGEIVYFISHHDGFRCLWAQRLDSRTKRPAGDPFSVHHFHNARLGLMNVGLGVLEIDVAPDKIVMNLGELTGNIWASRR